MIDKPQPTKAVNKYRVRTARGQMLAGVLATAMFVTLFAMVLQSWWVLALAPIGLLILGMVIANLRTSISAIVHLPDGLAFAEEATEPDILWKDLQEVYILKRSFSLHGYFSADFIGRTLPVPVTTLIHKKHYKAIERDWLAANPKGVTPTLYSDIIINAFKNVFGALYRAISSKS